MSKHVLYVAVLLLFLSESVFHFKTLQCQEHVLVFEGTIRLYNVCKNGECLGMWRYALHFAMFIAYKL